MTDAWLLVLALASSVGGMAWLALAMDVHWAQVRGEAVVQTPALVRGLRLLGALGLSLALLLCLCVNHPGIAVLVWVMMLAASSLLVAMTLTWRATWLRLFWPFGRAASGR